MDIVWDPFLSTVHEGGLGGGRKWFGQVTFLYCIKVVGLGSVILSTPHEFLDFLVVSSSNICARHGGNEFQERKRYTYK